MAETYCVFLRGINVNGIKIKMDALKAAFEGMGFTCVKTVLATGNVIVTTKEGRAGGRELKPLIEKTLSERFGYDAHVFLRSGHEIGAICAFARALAVPEGRHLYLLLCDDHALLPELKRLFDSASQTVNEQLLLSEHGAFWIVPKGSTLASEFGSGVLGNKKYKSGLTSRNINTVEKIYKAMLG